MTVTPAQAAVGGGAIILAGILEELTHAIAARPWAHRQEIDLRKVEVHHEFPSVDDIGVDVADPERLRWTLDIWVNFAPGVVGLAALAVLYLGGELPPLTDESVLLYVAWAWYTVPSWTDIREGLTDVEPDHQGVSGRYWAAWQGLTIESLGFILLLGHGLIATALLGVPRLRVGGPNQAWMLSQYLLRAGMWLMFAGVAWIFIRLEFEDWD
jgi:hypothetical protein